MKFPALLWSDMLPGHCHFLLPLVAHPMGLPPASSFHSEFCTREGIHSRFHKGSAEGTLHSLLTRVALVVDSPSESWQAGWEACISNICFSQLKVFFPTSVFTTWGMLQSNACYHLLWDHSCLILECEMRWLATSVLVLSVAQSQLQTGNALRGKSHGQGHKTYEWWVKE